MISKIFKYILSNAKTTSKKSVIDYFSKKDKIYTKKISIPGEKIILDGCKIKYVSLTSVSGKFDDVTPQDIRINLTNSFGMWVNVYISSCPQSILEQICKQLEIG